jgi:hypothetical protein
MIAWPSICGPEDVMPVVFVHSELSAEMPANLFSTERTR